MKRRSTIILHGSTSQKTILNFIIAAVGTWNLTSILFADCSWNYKQILLRLFNRKNKLLILRGCEILRVCSDKCWTILCRILQFYKMSYSCKLLKLINNANKEGELVIFKNLCLCQKTERDSVLETFSLGERRRCIMSGILVIFTVTSHHKNI
jgi:hypothetical protein